ncbi:PREDICTED: motilin receptor [Nanorana parkeri]|uniref:motilin receptor n=1 Tax=Nanorana parkeri TaxID=125878 RepID=UPI0008542A58|nr:PREDICTED: motilin receptor [Nanorana parkeri]
MKNLSVLNNESLPDLYDDDLFPPCTETGCPLFSIRILIPVTIASLVIMVAGLIGNAITILIIKKYKEMKTTTNFYLSSMAVSDMIILLCLPFDLYRIWRSKPWIFGGFLCKFFALISEGCTYSTILHITALSIERYLAICFPLKAKIFITKRRVKIVIMFLWVVALLSAFPLYNMLDSVEVDNDTGPSKTSWECRYTEYAMESGLLTIMMWVTTVYFFFPMFCLTILYGFIGKTLWKSRNSIRGPNAVNRGRSHRQTVKILAVVVLAFVICWLPFHIGRLIFAYTTNSEVMRISQYFNIVAMELFYLNASINPILYNLISKKYRTAAHRLLRLARPDERAYNVIKDETGGHTEITTFTNN